jgi:hypothetical protein
MRVALARHDVLLREAVATASRLHLQDGGDAFYVAFQSAPDAWPPR